MASKFVYFFFLPSLWPLLWIVPSCSPGDLEPQQHRRLEQKVEVCKHHCCTALRPTLRPCKRPQSAQAQLTSALEPLRLWYCSRGRYSRTHRPLFVFEALPGRHFSHTKSQRTERDTIHFAVTHKSEVIQSTCDTFITTFFCSIACSSDNFSNFFFFFVCLLGEQHNDYQKWLTISSGVTHWAGPLFRGKQSELSVPLVSGPKRRRWAPVSGASKVLCLPRLKRLNYVATCADGRGPTLQRCQPFEPHQS